MDLTGQRFGLLTALYLDDIGKHPIAGDRTWWICRCECGREVAVRRYCLRTQGQRSCGCQWHLKGADSPLWEGCGDISGQRWSWVKGGAKRRNLLFDLDICDAWEQFKSQGGKCALTGLSLSFKPNTASLDRIDSSKGYTKDNIQWVHKTANVLKSNFTSEELLDWCCKIADYSRGIITF